MANKLYEESDIAAIATAIRAKNGSSNTYTVSQMATAINNIPSGGGGGGGDVVNGIIENYKAHTSTISANTFVEFVELTTGDDTQLTTASGQYNYICARLIDTNKVFIALGNSNYLFGTVCTISSSTITAGTTTQLSTEQNSYLYASVVKVDTNKVFIAHSNSTSYLYGMLCTISGDTITVANDAQLVNGSSAYEYTSTALIDTNKVFIAHRNGSSPGYLYGMVCTISGTTITAGTDKNLFNVTNSNSYQYSTVLRLDANKVFISHRNGNYLYGMVCTVSGTTITVGTSVQLSTIVASYTWASATLIDTNKVFIAHRGGTYLHGTVCTISGTTITAGTTTQLPAIWTNSYYYATAVGIDTDKVFVGHQGENSYLYGIICTVSGTTITAGTDKRLSTLATSCQYGSAVKLDTNKVFIAHRGGNYTYGETLDILDNPQVIESTSKIDGLTKTSCTTTTAGQVWVLDN